MSNICWFQRKIVFVASKRSLSLSGEVWHKNVLLKSPENRFISLNRHKPEKFMLLCLPHHIFFVISLSRVNCSFYFKIGACRHGDRCSRLHNKPTFSQVRSLFIYWKGQSDGGGCSYAETFAVHFVQLSQDSREYSNCVLFVSLIWDLICVFYNPSYSLVMSQYCLYICGNLKSIANINVLLFQTIALLNIYRNPQNSAQSADGLTCKWQWSVFFYNYVKSVINRRMCATLWITSMSSLTTRCHQWHGDAGALWRVFWGNWIFSCVERLCVYPPVISLNFICICSFGDIIIIWLF